MMEHPPRQGSEAWNILRLAKPTASEFDRIVAPGKWEPRTGAQPASYLADKLAEHYCGQPADHGSTWAMSQGTTCEPEARGWYNFTRDVKAREIGFVTDDAMRYGASPDGLCGDDGGLELKCPNPATHIAWLLKGGLPPEHACQVQGCLYVTQRKWWDFVSYARNLPPLIVRVEPDPRAQLAIHDALWSWLAAFDAAVAKLDALNK
jgi:hypothetical protein